MTLVDDHHREVGIKPACEALSVSRATWYRRRALRSHEHPPVPRLVARAPMTSHDVSSLLAALGFDRSHARPRTSNDNAFSESQFKTIKYGPMWPSEALSFDQWSAWCHELFEWYNRRHHHEGIGHFTPHQVFSGEHETLRQVRQRALDDAFARNPERFVKGRPTAHSVPKEVWINRPLPPSPSGGSPGPGPAIEAPQDLAALPEPRELVTS